MRNLALGLGIGLSMAAVAWGQHTSGNGQDCAELAKVSLAHTTILKAEVVEAGKLSSPGEKDDPIYHQLPAFCRVIAESHPSTDSQIKIEVWLPLNGWNGKFLGQGNGGFAGYIDYVGLSHAIQRGYAGAGTDTGHSTQGAEWALGHPEKMIDYGYRGVHEMTLSGEALAQAFYGRAPEHRYFASCSNGGREALMEAQRFPADYDGILAGAPAYNWTHLVGSGVAVYQELNSDPGSYIPAGKIPAIAVAVLAQCNPNNSQGFLDDPRRCHFDPGTMLCKGAETDGCLTAPQVTALKALYAGAHTSDGKQVWPGYLPGAEDGRGGWVDWITGTERGKGSGEGFVKGYFADMVYSKPDLDLKTLNEDDALKAAVANTGAEMDAVNPDLAPFHAHGGKLILYHGWNDPAISALGTVDYYNNVLATDGAQQTAEFVRLFMVPGMQHCSGGPGPVGFGQIWSGDGVLADDPQHNIYLALETWVEHGVAPDKIIAGKITEQDGKRKVIMSRPLCAYPMAAPYKGSGDRNEAASYVCAAQ